MHAFFLETNSRLLSMKQTNKQAKRIEVGTFQNASTILSGNVNLPPYL